VSYVTHRSGPENEVLEVLKDGMFEAVRARGLR